MEKEVLGLLENKSYSMEALSERLKIPITKIQTIITNLIKKRLIYLDLKNKYSKVTEFNIIGSIDSDTKDRKFILHNNRKIYILSDNLHTAFKNDLVVINVIYGNFGNVLGIIERKNNRLVCEVVKVGKKLKLIPFNLGNEVSLMLKDNKILENYVEGDRVIVTLDNKSNDTNTILVNQITRIGHKDDPRSDEISIAISRDFDCVWSEEVLREAESVPTNVNKEDMQGRTDLTEDIIFTIDSVHTKDMDDAVSIKKLYNGNYLLGVHIADVAHYIKEGTELFKEARKRGTSLYLGETVIPMIPHKLSNGICSLNEGVLRLTKTCFMEIDSKGKLVQYKIVDSVIKSRKKMTYEELNAYFHGEEIDKSYLPFLEDIELMRELSNILTKAKNKRGNIEFENTEIKVNNDESEQPIEFVKRDSDEAEKIIENFMIMANETIASYFYWSNLPFIYRVHNLPDEVRLENTIELIQKVGSKLVSIQNAYGQKAIQGILNKYKGTKEYSIISSLLLRNMAKAQYSTKNIGHFALALDNYCHFTSPIRRFPDLMVHHLLDIFNEDYISFSDEKLETTLENISIHSSYKERQADDAERDYLKLKMAKFMSNHIGEVFEDTIVDIDHDSVYVKLDNNVIGILAYTEDFSSSFYIDNYNKELRCLHSKTKGKLGTRAVIKVHNVNIPLKEVTFELLELIHSKELTRKK